MFPSSGTWCFGKPRAQVVRRFFLAYGILVLCQPVTAGETEAPTSERVAILRTLAAELQSNHEQIQGFSADYALTDTAWKKSNAAIESASEQETGSGRDDLRVMRKIAGSFHVDMNRDRLFTSYVPVGMTEVKNLRSGKTQQVNEASLTQRHILSGDEWIKAKPALRAGGHPAELERGKVLNSAIIRNRQEVDQYMTYSTVVDPRVLWCESGTMTFHRALKLNLEWLERGNDFPLTITHESVAGDEFVVLSQEYRMSENQQEAPTVVKTTFSKSSGFQPTRMVTLSPEGNTQLERTWSYIKVDGLYFPSSYKLTKWTDDESGKKELEREFQFSNIRINQRVEERRFGWGMLGLSEGDQIRGDINGQVYRMHDGKPIRMEEYRD